MWVGRERERKGQGKRQGWQGFGNIVKEEKNGTERKIKREWKQKEGREGQRDNERKRERVDKRDEKAF